MFVHLHVYFLPKGHVYICVIRVVFGWLRIGPFRRHANIMCMCLC